MQKSMTPGTPLWPHCLRRAGTIAALATLLALGACGGGGGGTGDDNTGGNTPPDNDLPHLPPTMRCAP